MRPTVPTEILVRPAVAGDEAVWRDLWAGYCAFYRVTVAPEVTTFTWARICDPQRPVHALMAEHNGEVVGMAVYVLHDNTWNIKPCCYLEDLFVRPEARGLGVGHHLITWLQDAMTREGWCRLYWHTESTNTLARRLYDRFALSDGFVRYVIKSPS